MNHLELEYITCDLCGADTWLPVLIAPDYNYGVPGLFQIVRCRKCGLIYQNPRPTAATVPAAYPDQYRPYQQDITPSTHTISVYNDWKKNIKRDIADFYYFPRDTSQSFSLKKLLLLPFYLYARLLRVILLPSRSGSSPKVLDIGCGTGQFLAKLALEGWEVHAIEPNCAAAQKASLTLGPRIVTGTLKSGIFPASSFDLVTMWHVLEHLNNPSETLKEVYNLLKPGAWLVVMTPNTASLEFRLFRDKWFPLELPRHFYYFSPHTLRQILENAGFTVRLAYQIEPGTLAASLEIVSHSKGTLFGGTIMNPSRTLLWFVSACLAWLRQSGILMAYAQKRD